MRRRTQVGITGAGPAGPVLANVLAQAGVGRFCLRCPVKDSAANWPDAHIWRELRRRMAADDAVELTTGPITQKDVLYMRCVVAEPLTGLRRRRDDGAFATRFAEDYLGLRGRR